MSDLRQALGYGATAMLRAVPHRGYMLTTAVLSGFSICIAIDACLHNGGKCAFRVDAFRLGYPRLAEDMALPVPPVVETKSATT